MSKNTPGLPYPWIPGLDAEQQRQLERDFEHLRLLLPDPPGNIYDAIIDPRLTKPDPANHTYPNLTTLVQFEDWDTTYAFHVGVHQPGTPRIVEPSTIDIRGRGDIYLHGIGPALVDATHEGWDWGTLSVDLTQQVVLKGIAIEPTGMCS